MAEVVQGFGCETVMACGTAALREAANAPSLHHEAADLGIPIQVISGRGGGRPHLPGREPGHPLPGREPGALMDIGGGSTELTWRWRAGPAASGPCPGASSGWRTPRPRPTRPRPADLGACASHPRKILKKARKALPTHCRTRLILGTSGTLMDWPRAPAGRPPSTVELLRLQAPRLWKTTTRERMTGWAWTPSAPRSCMWVPAGPWPSWSGWGATHVAICPRGPARGHGLGGPGPRRHGPAAPGRPSPGLRGGAGRQAGSRSRPQPPRGGRWRTSSSRTSAPFRAGRP